MAGLDRPLVLAACLLYMAITFGIGLWAARRTHSAKDFWIAGQGLSLGVTALATISAAFSGFAFLGGPGLTYRLGLASLAICIPVGFTGALLTGVVGTRLRRLAAKGDVFTVPDVILERYQSRLASGLSAVAVVLGTVGYLGAQMLALGVILDAVFGFTARFGPDWGLPLAMLVGLAVLLFYSAAGGMVAGVYTDVFQGAMMLACGLAAFGYALSATGGWGSMLASIEGADAFGPRFLDPLGASPAFLAFGFYFVFGVGTLGQPHLLHKFFMIKDPRQLRYLPLLLSGGQILCVLLWLGIGLAVPALVAQGKLPPLTNPDDATPSFLLGFAPELLAGLVVAGILAAIMSTADSFISIAAAAFVRDLPRALGRTVERELLWGRVATGATLVAATLLAWSYGDLIALLGTFSFGTLGAALGPAIAVGLCWERVTARAAIASIVTGTVLNLTLETLARQTSFPSWPKPPLPPGVLPTAFALAASFTVLILVTLLERRRQPEARVPK